MEVDVATSVTPLVKNNIETYLFPKGVFKGVKTRIGPYWRRSSMGSKRVV